MAITHKKIRIGDLVIDTPKEMSLGREAIRSVLNQNGVSWDNDVTGYYLRSRLTHAGAVPISEDEPGRVIPFLTVVDWQYWLLMLLNFKMVTQELCFQSASLTILRSALSEAPKKRILRAEWEWLEEPERRRNAQPHWHVYGSEIEHGRSVVADRSMEKFHFAMTAGWHLELRASMDSQYRDPTPEGLAGWIQQCATYTRAQLESISRRI